MAVSQKTVFCDCHLHKADNNAFLLNRVTVKKNVFICHNLKVMTNIFINLFFCLEKLSYLKERQKEGRQDSNE